MKAGSSFPFRAILFLAISLWFFSSCEPSGSGVKLELPKKSEIVGLASPIQLNDGMTVVNLEDYFLDPLKITGVKINAENVSHTFFSDEKRLEMEAGENAPSLFTMTMTVDGFDYDFLVKKSLRKKVNLSYTVPDGKTVESVKLVGDLNNWNPANTPMTKEGNVWSVDLNLNPGRYPYQVVVDGEWILDPANPEKISNGMGGFNSILEVKKPDLKDLPFLYPKSIEGGEVVLGNTHGLKYTIAFWENSLLETKKTPEGIFIPIPANAKKVERSFIRVFAEGDAGRSNDIKIPLHFGEPVMDASKFSRKDKEAQIMYFALVDRFNNGNKDNDDPLEDERLTPIQNYMGGDLSGIAQKIKDGYFDELGINALWLSPITQNPLKAYQEFPEPRRWYSGYHGYWPISSSKIDHRFGTDEEFHDLVSAAHGDDVNVLLDYVCNHVHEEHPIYKAHPEWATQLDLPDGTKNIRIWDEQRLTTWFDTFMPTLDLSNPEVIELQADSAFYWLKKFNLDGYRHDATKHIPEEFWRYLTKKIKNEIIVEEGRPIYQIGETYGSNELISTYIGSGQVDAQFDFNLHFTARDAFAKDDGSLLDIANAMRETFDYFGYHTSMGNISGNHDQTRFMGYASKAVRYDEDPKEAGYARDIQVLDKRGYGKLTSMMAFLMSVPGVPVIYYGDEIGMVGGSDPDNRRMMRFTDLKPEEENLRKRVIRLTQMRKNDPTLTYGDTYMLKTDKDVLAYARVYFGQVRIFVFRKGNTKEIELELPDFLQGEYTSNWGTEQPTIEGSTLKITVPADGFAILKN